MESCLSVVVPVCVSLKIRLPFDMRHVTRGHRHSCGIMSRDEAITDVTLDLWLIAALSPASAELGSGSTKC